MNNLDDLRREYRLGFDSGDPWGSCMGMWFDVAEELDRRGADIPGAWNYRSGVMGPPDPEPGVIDFAGYNNDTLRAFGNELAEEAEALKAAGRDY